MIGRFEKSADINSQKIEAIIRNRPVLEKIPVVYDVDFGHTTPIFIFPIGGKVRLKAHRHEPIELTVEP